MLIWQNITLSDGITSQHKVTRPQGDNTEITIPMYNFMLFYTFKIVVAIASLRGFSKSLKKLGKVTFFMIFIISQTLFSGH